MHARQLESVARALVPAGKGILSYRRALQDQAMRAWQVKPTLDADAQRALHHRARCNGAARDGRYRPELERSDS